MDEEAVRRGIVEVSGPGWSGSEKSLGLFDVHDGGSKEERRRKLRSKREGRGLRREGRRSSREGLNVNKQLCSYLNRKGTDSR